MQHILTRRSARTTAPTFRLQHSRGHGIVENRVLAGCRRAAAGAGSPATTSADLPGHVASPPWYRSRHDRQAAVDSPLDSTWSRDIDDEDDGGGQRWFSVDDEESDAPDARHGGQRQSMQMLHVKSNTSRIGRLAKVRSDIQSHTRSKVQTVAAWLTVVKGAKSAGALMQAANALCTLPASELNGDKKLQQAVSGVAVLAGRAVAAWLLEKSNFVARIDVAFQLHGNLQNAAMANSTFRDAFIKLMHASGDEDSTFAESKYVVRHALLQARLHVCCPRFWQRLTAQSPISPPAAAASLLQAYARITKSRCVVADADVAARLIDNVSNIDLSSSQVWAVLWSLAVRGHRPDRRAACRGPGRGLGEGAVAGPAGGAPGPGGVPDRPLGSLRRGDPGLAPPRRLQAVGPDERPGTLQQHGPATARPDDSQDPAVLEVVGEPRRLPSRLHRRLQPVETITYLDYPRAYGSLRSASLRGTCRRSGQREISSGSSVSTVSAVRRTMR